MAPGALTAGGAQGSAASSKRDSCASSAPQPQPGKRASRTNSKASEHAAFDLLVIDEIPRVVRIYARMGKDDSARSVASGYEFQPRKTLTTTPCGGLTRLQSQEGMREEIALTSTCSPRARTLPRSRGTS